MDAAPHGHHALVRRGGGRLAERRSALSARPQAGRDSVQREAARRRYQLEPPVGGREARAYLSNAASRSSARVGRSFECSGEAERLAEPGTLRGDLRFDARRKSHQVRESRQERPYLLGVILVSLKCPFVVEGRDGRGIERLRAAHSAGSRAHEIAHSREPLPELLDRFLLADGARKEQHEGVLGRSEERRVGKEGRSRGWPYNS